MYYVYNAWWYFQLFCGSWQQSMRQQVISVSQRHRQLRANN